MPQHGTVPDVITYNALISALEKGKQPEKALEIFKKMQLHGVVPDVITYDALIPALEWAQLDIRRIGIGLRPAIGSLAMAMLWPTASWQRDWGAESVSHWSSNHS